MPVAISQIPMSEVVDDPPNVSSKQRNSQQLEPIWKDLQSGGGVHKTARHAYKYFLDILNKLNKLYNTLACPFSQIQSLHMSTPGGTKCIAC